MILIQRIRVGLHPIMPALLQVSKIHFFSIIIWNYWFLKSAFLQGIITVLLRNYAKNWMSIGQRAVHVQLIHSALLVVKLLILLPVWPLKKSQQTRVHAHYSKTIFSMADDNKMGPINPSVAKLESAISKIYNYFSHSSSRQTKLKNWQRFIEQPELHFKRLFDIRWSSIRDSIRPIIENIQPGKLLHIHFQLEVCCLTFFLRFPSIVYCARRNIIRLDMLHIRSWSCKWTTKTTTTRWLFIYCTLSSWFTRVYFRLNFLLFIFSTNKLFLYSGPVTKALQGDDISYFELMKLIDEKKKMLLKWIEQKAPVWGPSLSNYIQESKKNLYGLFKIEPANRKNLSKECYDHIKRLLQELDRRFVRSVLGENLSILFDSNYLMDHKEIIDQPVYWREALNYVREKFGKLPSFDKNAVQAEWELIKAPFAEYLKTSINHKREHFWKSFILLMETINEHFTRQFKNILVLLSIYLLSAANNAECERGFSAANRVQTNWRSRLMI